MKLFLVLCGISLAVAQTDVTEVVSTESSTGQTSVSETISTDASTTEVTSQTETSTDTTTETPDDRCKGDTFMYEEGCFDYCLKQIDKKNLRIRELYPVFVENRTCKVYSRSWFWFSSKEGVCKNVEVTRRGETQRRGVCVVSEKEDE